MSIPWWPNAPRDNDKAILPTSHSPFLSAPADLAAMLDEITKG
ncbi:hypothetical protein ACWGE0_21740 [Lentzea sp. NPDC054927]